MVKSQLPGKKGNSGSVGTNLPERVVTSDYRKSREPVAPGIHAAGRHLGLCASCELRQECKRPEPEGGVWSCSDYR